MLGINIVCLNCIVNCLNINCIDLKRYMKLVGSKF